MKENSKMFQLLPSWKFYLRKSIFNLEKILTILVFLAGKFETNPISKKNLKMLFSNVEANKNDKRNEPNLSRPSSAGETRKTLLKEVPIYAGHSDTELDDSDLTLDLSSLETRRISEI